MNPRITAVLFFFIIPFMNTSFALELSLQDSVDIAIQNNFDLQKAKTGLQIKESEIAKANSNYIPSFNIGAVRSQKADQKGSEGLTVDGDSYSVSINQKLPFGGTISFSDTHGKLKYSEFETETTDYQLTEDFSLETYTVESTVSSKEEYYRNASITFSQPLLKNGIWGPVFVNIKNAGLDFEIQKFQVSQAQQELILNVKEGYFNLLKNQQYVYIYQKSKKISEGILELVKNRFDLGLLPEKDVMLAQVELSKANANVLQARNRLEVSESEFQILLGIEDDITIRHTIGIPFESTAGDGNDEFRQAEFTSFSKSEIVSLIEKNPIIKALEYEIKKQNLAVEVAENQVLPDLNLQVKYKQNGWGETPDEAGRLRDKDISIGLSLSYPFYNRYSTENRFQQKKNLELMRLRLNNKKKSLIRLASLLTKQYRLARKRVISYADQLRTVKQYFEFVIQALDQGLVTQDEVYNAHDTLLNTELEYYGSQIEMHSAAAKLESIIRANL